MRFAPTGSGLRRRGCLFRELRAEACRASISVLEAFIHEALVRNQIRDSSPYACLSLLIGFI
jgi:hypothetical protein